MNKEFSEKVIGDEFTNVLNKDKQGLTTNEYKELCKSNSEIYQFIKKNVPKDLQELLINYSNNELKKALMESEYCFKQGVKSGLTNLSYLGNANLEQLREFNLL